MIKIAFNREEVTYRTQFENTLQIAESVGMGSSGALLEVAVTDVDKAKEALLNLGIVLDYDQLNDRFGFINILDKLSQRIPILGKLDLAYRFLIGLFLIATLAFGFALFYYGI